MSLNQSMIEKLKKMDVFCLNETVHQQNLRFVSKIYLSIGGLISSVISCANVLIIVFFCLSAKSKRSPICILSFFLAIFNVIKLFEFTLNMLIKTDALGLEKAKDILFTGSNKSNDYICKWLHFLPNFSGHIGVYIVLLLQFHRYLALKKITYSFNLLLHNYALTYFICIGLIFTFLIVDEFYLFDSYFTTIIYCPRTMVFICVFNDKFQLLNMLKFDTLIYHHVHTLIYNVAPIFLIFFINFLILRGLRQRCIDAALEPRSSARKLSVSGAYSATSLHRNSSMNLKADPITQTAAMQPLQPQAKRTRLSSSMNSQQPSPLQSIEISVKRSKREAQLYNLNEIFLQNSDVGYLSVWLSFAQIFNAVPTNFLSYLAEWSSSTIDLVQIHSSSRNVSDYESIYHSIPSKFLGARWDVPQINIYYMFILYGCIDMFNFSFFLFYQFYSCRLLKFEFNKFLLRIPFFRYFIKPIYPANGRMRTNSSTRVSISGTRRASKI